MTVEVTGPSEFQGAIISQLTKRSGVIVNTTENEGWFTVVSEVKHLKWLEIIEFSCFYFYNFQVPLNEMFGYSTELRSATQGKGMFTMEYARYLPARSNVQQELIENYQQSIQAKQAKRN